MEDTEKKVKAVENFGDMVNATERLTKPWRIALIVTNAFWAIVFATFILLAYLTPDTSYQYQDYEAQAQVQSAGSEVVAYGD